MSALSLVLQMTLTLAAVRSEMQDTNLDGQVRAKCLSVLRSGLNSKNFWPSIHAAEGLTLAGHGDEVRRALLPALATETDDQHRCGIARELVRAGDVRHRSVMLKILNSKEPHGHVHAAESLFKVASVGDGRSLRAAMKQADNIRLRIMAAAALGRCGNPHAVDLLREYVGSRDQDTARIAAWALGRVGTQHDIPLLRRAADGQSGPSRVNFDHALAVVGDAAGQEALVRNLSSSDPATRTYAATFAGDARLHRCRDKLVSMLEDPHEDARIRAAQTLLFLEQPHSQHTRTDDISVLVYPATADNPRYSEGSVLENLDGSLLYATTEFIGAGTDFSRGHIIGRKSEDGGRTWGDARVLQENTGDQNVMSVTLRRFDDRVAMFYLQKNSHADLRMYVRYSNDDADTFGERILVTAGPGYHIVNNDRVTRLSGGRILVPVSFTPDIRTRNHLTSHCCISDDGGRTWRRGTGSVDLPKRGAMEPEVIELSDGRVLMILRSQLGYIAASWSDDSGETWSAPESLGVKAPESPATLRRIPATGDLLLIWNHTWTPGAGHGGRRTPLTAALSSDEGQTWRSIRNLEPDRNKTFAYTSLMFVGDRAVMTYWETDPARPGISSRFRSLPVSWFYENPEH